MDERTKRIWAVTKARAFRRRGDPVVSVDAEKEAGDTIEVARVKSAAGQLLSAVPLPETLVENNTARRCALHARERTVDTNETLGNTLVLALGETNVPAEFAGYATVILWKRGEALWQNFEAMRHKRANAHGELAGPHRRGRTGSRRPARARTPAGGVGEAQRR